jgi:hypothetical protein
MVSMQDSRGNAFEPLGAKQDGTARVSKLSLQSLRPDTGIGVSWDSTGAKPTPQTYAHWQQTINYGRCSSLRK